CVARGRGDVGSCRGTSAVDQWRGDAVTSAPAVAPRPLTSGAGTPLPGCSMRARLAWAGVTWQTSRCSDGAAAPTLGLGRAELPGATERAPAGGTPSDRREGAGAPCADPAAALPGDRGHRVRRGPA